jgi:hypothetical protein
MKLLFKSVLSLLSVAACSLCAAQDIERRLPVPQNFGIREAGTQRAAVMTQSSGHTLARLFNAEALEASCRASMQMGGAQRMPTFDADIDQPDSVRVTRFMSPEGSTVADYSTHETLACTNPATPFNACHCRYGFVTARYITVKQRVAGRLQTWRTQVGAAKVTHNTGANRSNAPLMLEQQIDPAQLGPVVGTAQVAGLRCEMRALREGFVCLYAAGDEVPQVLRNALASSGKERELGSHNYRVTDVAARALVDAAVFEPPAGVAPVSSSASRPTR